VPYIGQEQRIDLQDALDSVAPDTAGELNYCITSMINTYLDSYGVTYKEINEVVGVLHCAAYELYRRVAAPYEDQKREENGDVYTV
jgi:ERCC4-type nuclease